MKVLALDVATRTGIAVGSAGGVPECWSEDLGKGKSEDYRFSRVLAVTHLLLARHTPDLVAVEAPIGGSQASSFLIGLAACVRGCAANRRVPCEVYHESSIRKHFLGKAVRAADFPGLSKAKAKQAIKETVYGRCLTLKFQLPEADYDAADAAALWDYACAKAGAQVSPAGELFR